MPHLDGITNHIRKAVAFIKGRETVVELGHLFRMQGLDPCRKLTLLKLEGTRRLGNLKLRWLELVEEDLKNVDVMNWRRKSRDRD